MFSKYSLQLINKTIHQEKGKVRRISFDDLTILSLIVISEVFPANLTLELGFNASANELYVNSSAIVPFSQGDPNIAAVFEAVLCAGVVNGPNGFGYCFSSPLHH